MKLPSNFILALPFLDLVAGAIGPQQQQQQPLLHPPTQEASGTISQPLLGFGTWNLKISGQNTSDAVSFAIQNGYRQIDCAAAYGNEEEVGKGIAEGLKKANLTRGDIWVTSKLWNYNHGNASVVEKALNKTLKDLGLDYLDLYLMHWPVAISQEKKELDYIETWKSMIALPKTRVLNLGISNFSPSQLKDIIRETGVKPAVHQMELHPYLQQSGWVAAHKALNISVTAYSPLGNANPTYDKDEEAPFPPPLLKNKVLVSIAEARNCTPAQVALAWNIGRGVSVIPKSAHPGHIVENFEAQACILVWKDLGKLRFVGRKFLTRFNNPSKSWGVKLFDGLDGV